MAGKFQQGISGHGNCGDSKNNRAFSEGVEHRAKGSAAAFPQSDNPHEGTGSDAETAWDTGWSFAQANAGGNMPSTGTYPHGLPIPA